MRSQDVITIFSFHFGHSDHFFKYADWDNLRVWLDRVLSSMEKII